MRCPHQKLFGAAGHGLTRLSARSKVRAQANERWVWRGLTRDSLTCTRGDRGGCRVPVLVQKQGRRGRGLLGDVTDAVPAPSAHRDLGPSGPAASSCGLWRKDFPASTTPAGLSVFPLSSCLNMDFSSRFSRKRTARDLPWRPPAHGTRLTIAICGRSVRADGACACACVRERSRQCAYCA